MFEKHSVESSSNILALWYDWFTCDLVVQFNSGKVYRYGGVAAQEYRKVIEHADTTIGKAFIEVIKRGPFPYEEVTPEEARRIGLETS